MSIRRPEILQPYVLWALDGALARYAGVSPDEAIGEPSQQNVDILFGVLAKGYRVVLITWREPGIVWTWLDKAKLQSLGSRDFAIQNDMPWGRPVVWVTGQDENEYSRAAALPERGGKKHGQQATR
jgi:hypothetical protein